MVIDRNLPQRLRALVIVQRGLVNSQIARYADLIVWDDGAHWDVATMGAVPTQAEIDSVTPGELAQVAALDLTTRFTATSRQKDQLATCAEIVRARGIVAWNAMTLQQKVAATSAEADVWVNIREFIETNL